MSKYKDTDYLSISTQVRAMENRLLTRERMERMIDARSTEEAVKILSECGYPELNPLPTTDLDAMLTQARADMFYDLARTIPTPELLEIFQLKYDYHNGKVLLKARAVGVSPTPLLMAGGRYSPQVLADHFQQDTLQGVSPFLAKAITEGQAVLSLTGDPQRCDLVLDRGYYEEMAHMADQLASGFLQGYVRLSIDSVNLRTLIRGTRMGKGGEFMAQILLSGGNIQAHRLLGIKGDDIPALFAGTPLAEAAVLGATLLDSTAGGLTHFERLCDNAMIAYLHTARLVPFGEHTVISYLHAKECEGTAIRTILSGRLAGLSGETIRERLREAYV